MASEIKVDTISEKTSAGGVTIDGLLIKDGGISGDVSLIGTTPTFTIGDAGAEDAALVFDGNAQDYYIALDDSADDLLIGLGSTVGTTPAISIDENLAIKTYGDITMTGTTPVLTIGDAGAEDTAIVFDGNAQDFYVGLDDSADDLVIGLGSAVGTTPAISINSDRDVTISDGAIDFDVASHDGSNGLKLAGTLVTATAAEINLIDGGTARGTTAIADGDGVLINDAGTMRMTSVETLSTYIGGGITEATIWRLTTSFTGNAAPIASNWEVDDTYANGLIGSGMTESSGVFTFPGTGYWLVMLHMSHFGGDSDNQYITCIVEYSSDSGSSWAEAVRTYTHTGDANEYANSSVHKIFDITNTSTQKVRMNTTSQDANAHTMGDTSESATWVTFIKLADT